jgi:hypothetical protein
MGFDCTAGRVQLAVSRSDARAARASTGRKTGTTWAGLVAREGAPGRSARRWKTDINFSPEE